jgi:hypothetical protein
MQSHFHLIWSAGNFQVPAVVAHIRLQNVLPMAVGQTGSGASKVPDRTQDRLNRCGEKLPDLPKRHNAAATVPAFSGVCNRSHVHPAVSTQ